MKWNVLPFLFLTPSLITGILLNDALDGPEYKNLYILLLIVLLIAFYMLLHSTLQSKRRSIVSVFLFLGFVIVGYSTSWLTWFSNKPHLSAESVSATNYFTAVIESKPNKTANSTRYEVTIQKIKLDDKWLTLESKAIMYAMNDEIFDYGDIVLINGKPSFLENRKNPHSFNYSLFLNRKGIYLQAYYQKEHSILLEENQHSSIRYLALKIGDVFEEILSRFISEDRELNMARAMVVGRRNEITPEMEYVYEATGTSHILAVSGLHVGIIYLLAKFLFKFAKRKGLRWLYYLAILISVWSFAIVTGFSPSVRRAAIMLSFIVVAEMIQRKSNIYNTLLASAFCILFFAPNLIYSVSFQFSYLAVLGIVYFYKKIYVLVYVKNRFLDFFWKITVLSISVQIATFAINIYYFHHFPALFFVTNLFAIPTAMMVVYGSLAIFFTSFLDYIPNFIGIVVEKWVFVYNEIMIFFSNLEINSIEDLSLKGIYVFLIISLVFVFAGFIESRRLAWFKVLTINWVFLALVMFYDNYKMAHQQQLVLYSVNNQCYVDVFLGNICYSSINEQNVGSQQEVIYNIQPNRDFHLITKVRPIKDLRPYKPIGKNEILVFGNQTFLFFRDGHGLSGAMHEVPVDFLVLSKSGIDFLEKSSAAFSFKNLVLDGTFQNWEIDRVKERLSSDVKIHAINKNGPFIVRI